MGTQNNTTRWLQFALILAVVVGGLIAGYYVQQRALEARLEATVAGIIQTDKNIANPGEFYTREIIDLKFSMVLDRLERMDGKLDQLLEDR